MSDDNHNKSNMLGTLLTGMAIGATLVILANDDMREKVKGKIRDMKEKGRGKLKEGKQKLAEKLNEEE